MTRRVGPSGVLVLPATAPRDVWLAERRNGIGSSDITRVVGASTFGNALSVWCEKTGRVPEDPGSEASEWGLLVEDVIARKWAELNDLRVTKVGMIAHAGHGWRRATLDRRVYGCTLDAGCALEIKTRSAFKAQQWNDNAVPDDVQAQTQWQMLVSGFEHLHVAVLHGGNRLEQRTVEADPALQGYLADEGLRVWQAVQTDVAPQVAPDAQLIPLLDRLHPDRAGTVELPAEAKQLLEDYRAAQILGSVAKDTCDTTKAALIAMLGDAEVGLLDGLPVFTYRASVRKAYTVPEQTVHSFRLKDTT